MAPVTLARNAMATRFEVVLYGDDPRALRAAGEEALSEIERIEAQLSIFRPTSQISRINARASAESVRVSPDVFGLLQRAQRLHRETGGAFDITIEPLMRCWGFREGIGRVPSAIELAEARACVGMNQVELDAKEFTVRFARPGMRLDLGAIGKGHAVEVAAGLLREAGVTSGLIHGGTSTAEAIGHPPDAESWKIGIESADARLPGSGRGGMVVVTEGRAGREHEASTLTAVVDLKNEALSVSAGDGRCFEIDGRLYGHILDPRSGEPVRGALLAAVVLPSATETDAFSTALFTESRAGYERLAGCRPGSRSFLVTEEQRRRQVMARGIAKEKFG